MEFNNLKLSVSRKSLYSCCKRQRNKIIKEVRKNACLQYCKKCCTTIREPMNDCDIQENPGSSVVSFTDDINISDNRCDIYDDLSSISSSSSSFNASFLETTRSEPSFRKRLAACFIDNNLTHAQGNSILHLLCTHPCFNKLPKDVRTLLDTPRARVITFNVEPGEYVHFDLEVGIIQNLPNASTINQLEIDFNIDGCSLDKSGSIQIWPIQCRIVNMQHTKPIIVGIYKGAHKPYDPNIFLQKFIADTNRIISNGGVNFHGNKVPIQLRCFIADTPARAFILNHRNHMSCYPCSKCKVSGIRYDGRYVFNGINHSPRTDEEYIRCLDEDHHRGNSSLTSLPIGMVSQVPFEYMHLVCLGVMKKLLSAWIHGKYSRLSKLSGRSISVLCSKMNVLKTYCPSEFARRPRSLDMCSKFKATEFRQFLLYTGPIVMFGSLDERLYKHFLFLHAAIRVLVSNSLSRRYLSFAELALQKFVLRSPNLYGPTFNSYNVHGLLHLVDDVRRFGTLDSFSAFPYESNMTVFRKYCRKPGLPLQQFFNRMTEIDNHRTVDDHNMDSSIHVIPLRNNDINCHSYRKIQFNGISLSIETRDNCCILNDGSICIIFNIIMNNNSYRLGVKRFLYIQDFYDIGISSSALQIYKCSTLNNEIFYVHVEEVLAKCYRLPLWNSTSTEDNDSSEEDDSGISGYVVAALIHSEKP